MNTALVVRKEFRRSELFVGNLVANAPHIPVHLGSLGVCVRTLIRHFPVEEGDTIVINHPAFGGSHLPDVTVVTPVFHKSRRVGFVVNRAHHSEIGGISPGSMPPDARNLEEEGVVIPPFCLMKKGEVDWQGMETILTRGRYPSRSVNENLADLNAALAASQGTMNNTLFGNSKFGCYETVCGGCDAGKEFHGESAVHHHMTNTRITDSEIMEHRYPLRLDEFSIRKNSGGKGKWNGGDGVIRRITFLEPVNLSVLTQRRNVGPFGLNGGKPGKPGCQKIIRKNGAVEKLRSVQNTNLAAGDQFIMGTLGGGGFGKS